MIGTNKKDGQETVDNLFADLEAGSDPRARHWPGTAEATEALLTERKPDHVTFEGWEAIDAAEVERGQAPRPPAGEVLPGRRDGRGREGRGSQLED